MKHIDPAELVERYGLTFVPTAYTKDAVRGLSGCYAFRWSCFALHCTALHLRCLLLVAAARMRTLWISERHTQARVSLLPSFPVCLPYPLPWCRPPAYLLLPCCSCRPW